MGYWDFGCSVAGDTAAQAADGGIYTKDGKLADIDGSDLDLRMRTVTATYVAHHPSRVLAVVGARLGRVTGLYRPIEQAHLQSSNEGSTPLWLAGTIMATWYVFAGLAIAGGVALRRRGVPVLVLASPMIVVLFTTVFSYGLGRFRAPAEAAVMLLAAVGVDHIVRRRWEGDAPPAPEGVMATIGEPAG
jgi:hypothetical protein